ncbi:MAG: MerC domain-containing protein [Saprospiraceae bacterium]|nr:MerC domain-containing protein [Saprospiraceae bacterium]
MRERFNGAYLDVLGMIASAVCAVHCALVPILLAIGALGGLSWMANHTIEFSFLFISVSVAGFAMYLGYRQGTLGKRTLLLFAVGFCLLLVGRMFPHDHTHIHAEQFLITASGGLIIAAGHVVNWFSQRKRPIIAES